MVSILLLFFLYHGTLEEELLLKNKIQNGVDETFEFTSVQEIRDYIYQILDTIEQDVHGMNRGHRLNRQNLVSQLQAMACIHFGKHRK